MGSSTGLLLVEDDAGVAAHPGERSAAAPPSTREDEFRLNDRKSERRSGDAASHPVWRDAEAARLCTERLLRLARAAGKRIHVLHISTADEFPLLAANRDIATVEVTPHHLSFALEDYARLGTLIQMNPPVREAHHRTGDLEGAAVRPRRRAGLGPCAAYAGGEGQALSRLALGHARRADAGAGHARLRQQGPPEHRTLRRSHLAMDRSRIFGIAGKGRIAEGYDADFTVVDLKARRDDHQ